jgi:hypothetical protein
MNYNTILRGGYIIFKSSPYQLPRCKPISPTITVSLVSFSSPIAYLQQPDERPLYNFFRSPDLQK